MVEVLSLTKAMADQNRIRILWSLLRNEEVCVCRLQDMLGLAASTTSQHLSILSSAGLITGRKDGRWVYYRLNNRSLIPANGHGLLEWIKQEGLKSEVAENDYKYLNSHECRTAEEARKRGEYAPPRVISSQSNKQPVAPGACCEPTST